MKNKNQQPKPRLLVIRRRNKGNLDEVARQQARGDMFHKTSVKISNKLGNAKAFYLALILVFVWLISGPIFNYSDTWQLVINTGTTIVTFLMVFIIQNTQNRDSKTMQLKLDELINAHRGARTEFVDIEDLTDAEIDELQEEFKKIREQAHLKK